MYFIICAIVRTKVFTSCALFSLISICATNALVHFGSYVGNIVYMVRHPSISRFHSAEHMAVKAFHKKEEMPSMEEIKQTLREEIDYNGVKYYTNEEYENTNMVESLMAAKDEFDDDVIVSYSDILFEEQMLKKMMDSNTDFACAVDDDWKAYWKKRYGKVDFDIESLSIDENDNITELGFEFQ